MPFPMTTRGSLIAFPQACATRDVALGRAALARRARRLSIAIVVDGDVAQPISSNVPPRPGY
jgi:hypothetical protein